MALLHYSSIVSLTNVFSFMSHQRRVCLQCSLHSALISHKEYSHSPAAYRQRFWWWRQDFMTWDELCVCGGWGDKGTWLLSLLFSLKGFIAAEQKATSWRPPLQVGTAIYFYSRVDAAAAAVAMEAAEAQLSPAEYLVPTTLPLQKIQKSKIQKKKKQKK